jgi:hypothetical protein
MKKLNSPPDSTTRARFSSVVLSALNVPIVVCRHLLRTAVRASISNQAESLLIQGVLRLLDRDGREDKLQEPGLSKR